MTSKHPEEGKQQQQRPCLNCKKLCNHHCGRCKAVDLCSKECQQLVWKHHRHFCKGISHPQLATDGYPSPRKCLIVDGLGPCGPGWDYMLDARQEMSVHGVDVSVVDVTKGGEAAASYFPAQLAALLRSKSPFRPTSILILGWGSGDVPENWNTDNNFKEALQEFVKSGGNLMVQGERIGLCGNWPSWFGKNWKSGDYFRTDHNCNDNHWCDWYHEKYASSRPTYNVKACMIQNVDPEDVLYGATEDSVSHSLVPGFGGQSIAPGSVAIAYGRYGDGTVSFFGDVNHEDATIQIMAIIARGHPAQDPE